jgi:transcriptional regulator with PAS, ATPase and Fis domain|nr:sigma 54-interacting transcriptional regulator [Kofleriaceae bacterium]
MPVNAWRQQYCPEIIGDSPELFDVLDTLSRTAATDCSILITGETGTGKELIARAIHRGSSRRGGAFVAVNCAAIPDSLLETELFGHVKGAYTGATNTRAGRFVAAHGGTIFLDEIGDLPLSAQAKLLRVLESRVVSPVGSDAELPVDVRIVAATHRNLEEMVALGTFRADLYFRLSVVPVHLSALRERGEDLVAIAQNCIERAAQRLGREVTGLDASGEAALRAYAWPGNIRELAHLIERAVLLARRSTLGATDLNIPGSRKPSREVREIAARTAAAIPTHIGSEDTQPVVARGTGVHAPLDARGSSPAIPLSAITGLDTLDLRSALENLEKQMIERALNKANGNRTEAAALLGLNRTTLVEKLRKYAV